MAMIELQVWWPSSVLGTVLGSMDVFVEHAAAMAASSEFCSEWDAAQAVKPHLEFFLLYLDSAVIQPGEAPWLVLYAYKAFLIASKLLCHQMPEAIEMVGVQPGDRKGAIAWARGVFLRRKPSKLVYLVNKSVCGLADTEP